MGKIDLIFKFSPIDWIKWIMYKKRQKKSQNKNEVLLYILINGHCDLKNQSLRVC